MENTGYGTKFGNGTLLDAISAPDGTIEKEMVAGSIGGMYLNDIQLNGMYNISCVGASSSITLNDAFIPNTQIVIGVQIAGVGVGGMPTSGHGIRGNYPTIEDWVNDINIRLPELQANANDGGQLILQNLLDTNLPVTIEYPQGDDPILSTPDPEPTLAIFEPAPNKVWGFCLSPYVPG